MPDFKAFILSVVRQDEALSLQPGFQAVLEKKALLDSVRIVRPDFLRLLVFFMLKTQPQLQQNCLLLLKSFLESKNRISRCTA